MANGTYETVKIERDSTHTGLTWVILNRPEKRNAMSPQVHFDMADVLNELETDTATKVLVLTGAGDAWCAGPRGWAMPWEIDRTAAPVLGVQVDFPRLAQRVRLDEMTLVVDVKAVGNCVVFEVGDEACDIDSGHYPSG